MGQENRVDGDVEPKTTAKTNMNQISSRWTVFHKKVFPVCWFGFVGIFLLISLVSLTQPNHPPIGFLLIPLGMMIFGYILMRFLVFDLIDTVYDAGDCLILRNRGEELQVFLKEIKNVNYCIWTNPSRVTLYLRSSSPWGSQLTFSARKSRIPFMRNPDIDDLIDRIDQARLAASNNGPSATIKQP